MRSRTVRDWAIIVAKAVDRLLGARHPDSAAARSPIREVRLGPREVVVERGANGTVYLRSPHRLGAYADKITERLEFWAANAPTRIFLAERDGSGAWRTLTYAQMLDGVRRVGEALLHRDLSAERPIAILSGNDIEHAILGLAATYVGIPYAPISPAYSLVARDFEKLRHIVALLTPGLVFAADGGDFAGAVQSVVPHDVEIVTRRGQIPGRKATPFSELLSAKPTASVDLAHARVGPDTIAKFLFTSGSTGVPKAVINTQRMLCSNQEMIRTAFPYFRDEPPVLVDWAPWHHTGGGNHDFGIVLYNGGSFYIDSGKPLPGAIETTVHNLRSIAPTWYFNVPKGFTMLLPYLRTDAALREKFFERVKVLFYAGASLAQHVDDEFQALALATCGERVLMLTSLGATEAGPLSIIRTWDDGNAANVGVPAAGLEVKLAPVADKLEVRLRGPNITPGYWRQPELTRGAFDEEGFYRMGDAVTFADAGNPAAGLLFDGRVSEDFKLATGTWVNVELLRTRLVDHLAPYARDVVVTGLGQDDIGVLIFPDFSACSGLVSGAAADDAPAIVISHPQVRLEFRKRLEALAQTSTGSSNRVVRALLVEEPPSLESGEMTDKGSINHAAVLKRRADFVAELYALPRSSRVIALDA